MNVPHASVILRLLAFTVPAALALAGVQPLVAAIAGSVPMSWATGLTAPAVLGAGATFIAGRMSDRGDVVQPPWYAAWLLLPGAFLLAGAAAMCIFGAFVQLTVIQWAMLGLLGTGAVSWLAAMVLLRAYSR